MYLNTLFDKFTGALMDSSTVSVCVQVRYQCVGKSMLRLLALVSDFYDVTKRSYKVKSKVSQKRLFQMVRLYLSMLIIIMYF